MASTKNQRYLKILSSRGGKIEENITSITPSEATVDRALTLATKNPFTFAFQILKTPSDEGPTHYIGIEIRDVADLEGRASQIEIDNIRGEDDVAYAVKAINEQWYPLYRGDTVYDQKASRITKISPEDRLVPYRAQHKPKP